MSKNTIIEADILYKDYVDNGNIKSAEDFVWKYGSELLCEVEYLQELNEQNEIYKEALEHIKEHSDCKVSVFIARRALERVLEGE